VCSSQKEVWPEAITFLIFGFDRLRAGWRHHIGYRFAEHGRAVNAQIFFGGTVNQQILQSRHALDDDRRRHVFDDRVEECPRALQFALGPLAFGNVLVGCDPAAAWHRQVYDRNGTAVLQFDIQRERLALHEHGAQVGVVAFRIKRKGSGVHARGEKIRDTASAPSVARIDVVHLAVPLDPDGNPAARIEHAQALIHVIESDVEPKVLFA
jgi:hypothetical protein